MEEGQAMTHAISTRVCLESVQPPHSLTGGQKPGAQQGKQQDVIIRRQIGLRSS